MPRVPLPTFVVLVLLVALAFGQEATRSPNPKLSWLPARQVDVAQGLEHPWGLAFLPDGRMLVTERPGRLRIVGRDGSAVGAARRRPASPGRRPGGLTRRRAEPHVRSGSARLSLVLRAGRGRCQHRGGAWAARRARARGHADDLAPATEGRVEAFTGALGWCSAPTARCSSRSETGAPRLRSGSLHHPRQDRPNQPRRDDPARQSVRRSRRRPAGDLVVRPSQRAGGHARRARATVDSRAWRARRRRAEQPAARP